MALTLTVLAGFIAGCITGDESASANPVVVRRDSAGISIVESTAPSWEDGDEWQIGAAPEVVIGSSRPFDASPGDPAGDVAEDVLLERVQEVKVLPDGRIVVADAGQVQVMVFDSEGGLESRFMRRGEGPGELNRIGGLHVCGVDSVVVVDRSRMLVFDDQGSFARQVRQSSIEAVSPTCGRVLTQEPASTPPLDRWGLAEDVFAWVDPVSGAVDTVTKAGLLEVWTRELYGVVRPWVVPWGTSRLTHATDGDLLVIGCGRVPELRWYDSAGAITSVLRWSAEARPITRSDRQRYSDVRLAWLASMPDDPESRFLFPPLDEYPELPAEKPLFDRVLVDDAGGVWVRAFPENSFGLFDRRLPEETWSNQTWTVFDPEGVWLGDLTLPDRFDLRAVAGGRLFGVAKDSLDVETVQVFELRKQAAGDQPE